MKSPNGAKTRGSLPNPFKIRTADSEPERPLWTGGNSAEFVLVRRFLNDRAKKAGAWGYWEGTESPFQRPEPCMHWIFSNKPEHIMQAATLGPGTRYIEAIVDVEETCRHTGIPYQTPVYFQPDWEAFEKAATSVARSHIQWEKDLKESVIQTHKACAVMAQAVGGGAHSQVRSLLDEGKPDEAWTELNEEYTSKEDSHTAAQLRSYMHALKLMKPADLREYLDKVITLRDAIGECKESVSENEFIEVLRKGIMEVRGNKGYAEGFAYHDNSHGDGDSLIDNLQSKCIAIVNAEHADALRQYEVLAYNKAHGLGGSQPFNANAVEPVRTPAVTGNQSQVKGTNGRLMYGKDGILECRKCECLGHIEKFCQNNSNKNDGASAANTVDQQAVPVPPSTNAAAMQLSDFDNGDGPEEEDDDYDELPIDPTTPILNLGLADTLLPWSEVVARNQLKR